MLKEMSIAWRTSRKLTVAFYVWLYWAMISKELTGKPFLSHFWSEGYGSESDMRFVFCAVAICHILQDDSHINWAALRNFIRASLNYDGGIGQGPGDESHVAICHILQDDSHINWSALRNFIQASLNYDGGIGQGPGDESHGGSTFCAIASLSLSNRLWDESVLSRSEISRLVKWALWKQDQGFHGRAHKDDDSCYSFWIGATLEILNANHLLDKEKLRSFLLIAQHQPLGGFCKVPDPTGFPGECACVSIFMTSC
ncbi:prenyltransferase and squalene oxidase repeat-containing domain protein [Ancylostoma duodenale]|uniref:Prenyltransferase and squalene oxidase repeat-containing domain protein n=1 Tax=Ancylostoma duodenale TaxID=51022 RepID=A0A0C2FU20_9BILA|nr:prenyltransferase and squalene oxidase repeat-containing domain protein [Ancylostoma duodenale]